MTERLFIRLAHMAKGLNEKCPGYTAVIEKAFTSTDSNYAGTRIRREGKGRSGNKLTITNADGARMLEHDASRGGSNDQMAWAIEQLWGPVWNDDCKKGKNLVCRACKAPENKTTRGHYVYQFLWGRVFCPSCNKKLEAGTLKI